MKKEEFRASANVLGSRALRRPICKKGDWTRSEIRMFVFLPPELCEGTNLKGEVSCLFFVVAKRAAVTCVERLIQINLPTLVTCQPSPTFLPFLTLIGLPLRSLPTRIQAYSAVLHLLFAVREAKGSW